MVEKVVRAVHVKDTKGWWGVIDRAEVDGVVWYELATDDGSRALVAEDRVDWPMPSKWMHVEVAL